MPPLKRRKTTIHMTPLPHKLQRANYDQAPSLFGASAIFPIAYFKFALRTVSVCVELAIFSPPAQKPSYLSNPAVSISDIMGALLLFEREMAGAANGCVNNPIG